MMNSIITKFRFIVFCLLSLYSTALKAQVRIRIFADSAPASALFSVTESEYFLIIPDRKTTMIHSGESVVFLNIIPVLLLRQAWILHLFAIPFI